MAVSIKWGLLFVGALRIKALLFGVYMRAPDFGKLSYGFLPQTCVADRSSYWIREPEATTQQAQHGVLKDYTLNHARSLICFKAYSSIKLLLDSLHTTRKRSDVQGGTLTGARNARNTIRA